MENQEKKVNVTFSNIMEWTLYVLGVVFIIIQVSQVKKYSF